MSREQKDKVFDALKHLPATVSTSDRLMWLVIADRQSDMHGYAWPSSADIAARTGLTAGWVRHSIIRLEMAGLVTVERRPGRSNRYRIVIPNLRAQRAGTDQEGCALSAQGCAPGAQGVRAERAHNQLENQLENLPPTAVVSPPCEHRWRSVSGECPTCLAEEQREAM